jgi:SAM-dependent methyltransferase
VQTDWPILLYKRSPLKQAKLKKLVGLLGETDELRCLDIGSDNGVISYLFRQRGGRWKSADLDDETVQSIRELVNDDVYRIDGKCVPFEDNEFDRIVIVDFLEHIESDHGFVRELFRVLKPGGELIVNVPHIKNSMLRKLRLALGQTDEKHGHLRPGYTVEELKALLDGRFTLLGCETYSKFFSECVDTVITLGSGLMKSGEITSSKGMIVTGSDLHQHQSILRIYSLIFPLVWLFSKLDVLLFWCSGYMLVAKARSNKLA